MLVEFSVGNYRSFKEKQTLSMVASGNLDSALGHQFETGFGVAPALLQSACILGPNASGKSNLIRAMDFFCDFATLSSKDLQEGDPIDVEPFKLDTRTAVQPSEFEITFIFEETLYRYGFAATRNRIHAEQLFSRSIEPGSKERQVFTRELALEKDLYEWDINERILRGSREEWRAATRSNATFLSTAVQLNANDLKKPFTWLKEYFHPFSSAGRFSPGYTFSRFEYPDEKEKILRIVQDIDLSITGMEINKKEFDPGNLPEDMSPALRAAILEKLKGQTLVEVRTVHTDEKGKQVYFDLEDESDGTQVIVGLAGPWLNTLENGYTLVVDELNNSLHPGALRYLVELFHSKEHNRKNAQLIFTTHGTSILSRDTMQRDQVWFMECSKEQSTDLYPLTDFKPRKGEALEKGYLGGRYGALPNIKGFY